MKLITIEDSGSRTLSDNVFIIVNASGIKAAGAFADALTTKAIPSLIS
jgi:hypothetical protein